MNYLKIIYMLILSSLVIFEIDCRSSNFAQSSLLIESNSIQQISENVSGEVANDSRALKRVYLSNRTVTCNDGSQSGFYLRKSPKSKRWVIFLEGGWHCFDLVSCKERWRRSRHLMTSTQWPETRGDGGILSPLSADNPHWHDANHVLVPYCSSDSWSGTRKRTDSGDGYAFMGSLILRQVIIDLIPLGLEQSQGGELLLSGSSAGGLGVMLNLDKIKKILREEKQIKILVRGVSDSGWFLDRNPYAPNAISASEVIKKGWQLWHGSVPESCTLTHKTEPWRCYFGHHLYPTLKSPLFIFQWLFDEAQMRADSVGAPVTPQQWDYIHEMGGALRDSLDGVTAVFAPSCIGHAVLTKRDWLNIKIDDISLADALKTWEIFTSKKRNRVLKRSTNIRRMDMNNSSSSLSINLLCGKHKQQNKKNLKNNKKQMHQQRHKQAKDRRRQRKKNEERKFQSLKNTTVSTEKESTSSKLGQSQHISIEHFKINDTNVSFSIQHLRSKRKPQKNNSKINQTIRHKKRQPHKSRSGRCTLRLLERCSWPQCNHSCPSLTNPLTGEELRFLELLASFGLDIEAVATALGVDMQTLNNMDHTVLVNLLTQTSS